MRKNSVKTLCAAFVLFAFSCFAVGCGNEPTTDGEYSAKTEKTYTAEQTYCSFDDDRIDVLDIFGDVSVSNGACVLGNGGAIQTRESRKRTLAYFEITAESGFSYTANGVTVVFDENGVSATNAAEKSNSFSGQVKGERLLVRVESRGANEIRVGIRGANEPIERLYDDAAIFETEGSIVSAPVKIAAVGGTATIEFVRISSLEGMISNETDDYDEENEPNLYDKKPSISGTKGGKS